MRSFRCNTSIVTPIPISLQEYLADSFKSAIKQLLAPDCFFERRRNNPPASLLKIFGSAPLLNNNGNLTLISDAAVPSFFFLTPRTSQVSSTRYICRMHSLFSCFAPSSSSQTP